MSDLRPIKRALISVYDKTGLTDLARFLKSKDILMVSTGKTARYLSAQGYGVTDVATLSQFPEILDGRIKTISSRVFASLLFDREKASHRNAICDLDIPPIDLLVVNLYPFQKVAKEADASEEMLIENIDIGGPAMMRAAAKNHHGVTVLSDPGHYDEFISHYIAESGTRLQFRRQCAERVFAQTADYDQCISQVFAERISKNTSITHDKGMFALDVKNLNLNLTLEKRLRYGENPHQDAWLYSYDDKAEVNLAKTPSLFGKEISYNNLLDAEAAIWALRNLIDHQMNPLPTAVVVKHGIPCGAAHALEPHHAISHAISSDPTSAFGGIMAVSSPFDLACALAIEENFFEIIIAPSFSEDARGRLLKKKHLRLLAIDNLATGALPKRSIRSIFGGALVQDCDVTFNNEKNWTVATSIKPSAENLSALDFAFRVVKTTPSNAIAVASNDRLLGLGAGQPNRIKSVELAILNAKSRGFDITNAALASDAFFPFDDGLTYAHDSGIRLVIQPGGSIRDQEIIAKAEELGMCMVFTHRRHFKH